MKENMKKFKDTFDKITSQNSTNWQLLLFWLIVVELFASIIEYLFLSNVNTSSVKIPHTIYTEIIVAIFVTSYVWFFIYNIINGTKRTLMKFMFFSVIGLYFIVTNDFTLNFLMQNLNPLHFFDLEFGFVFFVEVFLKLLMAYLVYQVFITIKNKQ